MGDRHAPLFYVNTLVLHLYMLSIPVSYYKLPAPVLHASLVRAVSSFMLESCLCSNKFIGVCVGTENVACGS